MKKFIIYVLFLSNIINETKALSIIELLCCCCFKKNKDNRSPFTEDFEDENSKTQITIIFENDSDKIKKLLLDDTISDDVQKNNIEIFNRESKISNSKKDQNYSGSSIKSLNITFNNKNMFKEENV